MCSSIFRLMVMQFHYHLIVHQWPSNFHIIYNDFNLMIFNGLSNDNENLTKHANAAKCNYLVFTSGLLLKSVMY
jgi:hypothetical protein